MNNGADGAALWTLFSVWRQSCSRPAAWRLCLAFVLMGDEKEKRKNRLPRCWLLLAAALPRLQPGSWTRPRAPHPLFASEHFEKAVRDSVPALLSFLPSCFCRGWTYQDKKRKPLEKKTRCSHDHLLTAGAFGISLPCKETSDKRRCDCKRETAPGQKEQVKACLRSQA